LADATRLAVSGGAPSPDLRGTLHFGLSCFSPSDVPPLRPPSFERGNACAAIARLSDAVASAGPPACVQPTDAFWSVPPGERFPLSPCVVARPSSELGDGIFVSEATGGDVTYRGSFSEAEALSFLRSGSAFQAAATAELVAAGGDGDRVRDELDGILSGKPIGDPIFSIALRSVCVRLCFDLACERAALSLGCVWLRSSGGLWVGRSQIEQLHGLVDLAEAWGTASRPYGLTRHAAMDESLVRGAVPSSILSAEAPDAACSAHASVVASSEEYRRYSAAMEAGRGLAALVSGDSWDPSSCFASGVSDVSSDRLLSFFERGLFRGSSSGDPISFLRSSGFLALPLSEFSGSSGASDCVSTLPLSELNAVLAATRGLRDAAGLAADAVARESGAEERAEALLEARDSLELGARVSFSAAFSRAGDAEAVWDGGTPLRSIKAATLSERLRLPWPKPESDGGSASSGAVRLPGARGRLGRLLEKGAMARDLLARPSVPLDEDEDGTLGSSD
jgi:hypothetical protein